MLGFLLQGAGIGVSAALSPGPFQSLIIAQALLGGWRRAAPVCFGPLLADIPIAFVLTFVVSQVPDDFLRFVKFAGALLLLFLAWGVYKEIRQETAGGELKPVAAQSPWKGFLQGGMMLYLSPGPYLFWGLVLGPLLLDALDQSLLHAFLFLLGFYTCSIGGLILIAYVIGRIGQLNERGRLVLQVGSLILMVVFGVLLTINGLQA